MANDYFNSNNSPFDKKKCAMKVGTDGVLLGSWTDLTHARRLLDIGTGTGLMAIMAAQRNLELIIDAIEIDPAAFEQARENANNSPWRERIHLFKAKCKHLPPRTNTTSLFVTRLSLSILLKIGTQSHVSPALRNIITRGSSPS